MPVLQPTRYYRSSLLRRQPKFGSSPNRGTAFQAVIVSHWVPGHSWGRSTKATDRRLNSPGQIRTMRAGLEKMGDWDL